VYAAEMLREKAPKYFVALATFPVTYHYANAGHYYRYTRPTIELYPTRTKGEAGLLSAPIKCINWSPPFQGPFTERVSHLSAKDDAGNVLREYLKAAKAFSWLLNSPENVWKYRLQEGDLVIFDNRRTLHAREAFDASAGERWLKGAYLDDDVYRSKLRELRLNFVQESYDHSLRAWERSVQDAKIPS